MTHTRFAPIVVLALVAITISRSAAADVRLTGFGGVSFINDESKGSVQGPRSRSAACSGSSSRPPAPRWASVAELRLQPTSTWTRT